MDDQFLRLIYFRFLTTVEENNMVNRDEPPSQLNSQIQTSLDRNSLIRSEASRNNIPFGSNESTIYHIHIYPTYPEENYVLFVNLLIANALSIVQNFPINQNEDGNSIDIEFIDPRTLSACIVLVKNGLDIIKSFIPKN